MPQPTTIIILSILIAAALVIGLTVTQFLLLKRLKRALHRAERAVSDRGEVFSFLEKYAHSLLTETDPNRWLQSVAGDVATAIGAQTLLIYTLADDGETLNLVARTGELPHLEPNQRQTVNSRLLEDLSKEHFDVAESRLGEVILSNKSILEHPASHRRTPSPLQSLLAVPVAINNQNIGVICAVNKRIPGLRFTFDDQYLLTSLSNQVALGSTLIQVYEKLAEQQRIEQDLRLAREIQNSLLPDRPPAGKRLKINAVNIPAREVSGDFYDFITLDPDSTLVVIADASGKGVPACMLMAMCRSFLRSNAIRFKGDLEGLMHQLNHNLFADTDELQFITMAVCLVDKKDNTIEYARAGHTELLIKTPQGEVQILEPQGPALGLLPSEMEPQFDTFSFTWQPGASILLFTDGITEALNDQQEEFGLDRLVTAWKRQSLDPIEATEGILATVRGFTGASAQADDQTMVVLSRALETPVPGVE